MSPAFLHMHSEASRDTSVYQAFFFSSKTWLVHKNFFVAKIASDPSAIVPPNSGAALFPCQRICPQR